MAWPTLSNSRLTLALKRGEGDGSLKGRPEDEIREIIAKERLDNATDDAVVEDQAQIHGDEEEDVPISVGKLFKLALKRAWQRASLFEQVVLATLFGIIGLAAAYILFVLARRWALA